MLTLPFTGMNAMKGVRHLQPHQKKKKSKELETQKNHRRRRAVGVPLSARRRISLMNGISSFCRRLFFAYRGCRLSSSSNVQSLAFVVIIKTSVRNGEREGKAGRGRMKIKRATL